MLRPFPSLCEVVEALRQLTPFDLNPYATDEDISVLVVGEQQEVYPGLYAAELLRKVVGVLEELPIQLDIPYHCLNTFGTCFLDHTCRSHLMSESKSEMNPSLIALAILLSSSKSSRISSSLPWSFRMLG